MKATNYRNYTYIIYSNEANLLISDNIYQQKHMQFLYVFLRQNWTFKQQQQIL